MSPALLSMAFVQGLAGSAHCLGMCGPFALVLSGPEGRRPLMIFLYNAGRTTSYVVLGLTLGFLGAAANRFFAGLPAAVIGGGFIILFGLSYLFPGSRLGAKFAAPPPFLRKLQTRILAMGEYRGLFAFLFGVSTGLLPCGMLYAALGLAAASGEPLTGAAAMFAFSIGTWPALFLAAGAGPLLSRVNGRTFRVAMAVLMIAMGLFIIGRRLMGGGHEHKHHGQPRHGMHIHHERGEHRLVHDGQGKHP